MMKKLLKINIILVLFFININIIVLAEDVTESVSDSLEVNKYLNSFETFIEENNIEGFDIKSIYSELISGQGVNYNNIIDIFVSNLVIQVKESAKTVSTLFIIIVIMAVLSSLQLDKNSDVVKISKLIVIICVSSILLKNYIEIVNMFKDIVKVLSSAMQIVSTFLTGILIASGKITSTGIIQPLLVFIASFIFVVTEYIVIPFFTISIAINIVSKISDNLKLDKISEMFRKSSLYIFSSIIAIFILVLSMETTITKSIDNVYFKTTQNIVSDVIPVVGKFLSDSLDTVLGATELIGKVGGAVALITVIILVSVPLIKILIVVVLYKLLSAFSEPINEDKTISTFIDSFAKTYKDMLGILIGIIVLFVMSTGIIMGMISTISG
ncbi:MAG: hypothetical protein ACI4ON_05490 [Clostridia bacterium]